MQHMDMAASFPDGTASQILGPEALASKLRETMEHLSGTHYCIAKSLELCYLHVFKYPGFAKQVHQHAADAREIHELCSSLMRRFEVLAHQIGDNEIPDIVEFLEDGEHEIVLAYLDSIIETMGVEADNTTLKCKKVDESISQKACNVMKQQLDRQHKLEKSECRRAAIANIIENISEEGSHRFSYRDVLIRIARLGIPCLDTTQHIEKTSLSPEQRSTFQTEMNVFVERKEQKERGNAALFGAFTYMCEGQNDLSELLSFWNDTAAALKDYQQTTETVKVFNDGAKNHESAKVLRNQLIGLKERFSMFGRICKEYMDTCMHDPKMIVEHLFGFLDGRVENMGVKLRNEKIAEIKIELEAKRDPNKY